MKKTITRGVCQPWKVFGVRVCSAAIMLAFPFVCYFTTLYFAATFYTATSFVANFLWYKHINVFWIMWLLLWTATQFVFFSFLFLCHCHISLNTCILCNVKIWFVFFFFACNHPITAIDIISKDIMFASQSTK